MTEDDYEYTEEDHEAMDDLAEVEARLQSDVYQLMNDLFSE